MTIYQYLVGVMVNAVRTGHLWLLVTLPGSLEKTCTLPSPCLGSRHDQCTPKLLKAWQSRRQAEMLERAFLSRISPGPILCLMEGEAHVPVWPQAKLLHWRCSSRGGTGMVQEEEVQGCTEVVLVLVRDELGVAVPVLCCGYFPGFWAFLLAKWGW